MSRPWQGSCDRRLRSQGLHRGLRGEHDRRVRRGPPPGGRRGRARRAPHRRRRPGRPPRRRDPGSRGDRCIGCGGPARPRAAPGRRPGRLRGAWWSTSRSRTPPRTPGGTPARPWRRWWRRRSTRPAGRIGSSCRRSRSPRCAPCRPPTPSLALGALWGFATEPGPALAEAADAGFRAVHPFVSVRRPRPGASGPTPRASPSTCGRSTRPTTCAPWWPAGVDAVITDRLERRTRRCTR